jgi:hypothetical protein
MTIILDKCAHIKNTIKIYLDSMYVCDLGSCTHVSTILPLYMAELFWGCGNNISYSCYQSNHEWLNTYSKRIILYSICYLDIQLEYQSFKYVCIFIIW